MEQDKDQQEDHKLGSSMAAFWNFFKNMFGAGILVLPHAFESAGLVAGGVVYALALAVTIGSMLLLLRCKEVATERTRGNTSKLSQIGTYPGLARFALGAKGYWVLAFLVTLLELAFATGWVIVASHNLATVLWKDGNNNSAWVVLCLFPLLCLLSFIPHLRQLWVLSFLGFFVYCFGVMGTSYWYIANDSPVHETPIMANWSTLPKFFGTAMYGLEAILMVLPVQSSMQKPSDAAMVISSGATLYAILAGVFGAVCYAYGLSSCAQGIMDCLPPGDLTSVVRMALSISLIVGYPCILYPVTEIMEEMLFDPPSASSPRLDTPLLTETVQIAEPSKCSCFGRYAMRVAEVSFTCIVGALFADDFETFANIVGAVLIPIVGFTCPAVLHAAICGYQNLTFWGWVVDGFFVIFSLAFLGVAVSTL